MTIDLAAGTYYIYATSYEAGETGAYTLQVSDCSESMPPCVRCEVGTIDCEARVTGALAPSDCILDDGTFADIYRVELATFGQVTVQLTSTSFDTYLSLEGEDCLPPTVDFNDDCGLGNVDQSCLSVFLEAGTYFIYVNSFAGGETGPYSLQLSCVCPRSGTPLMADPEEGASEVAIDTFLSWNGAALPLAGGAVVRKTVYGTDDRLDEFQVTDPRIRSVGDSTVAIVSRSALTLNQDGTYSLPKETLAMQYQRDWGRPLCDDEPFRGQPTASVCSGFLVAPDVVATAGHCITSSQECADFAFIFGFVMLDRTTPVVRVDASQVYSCSEIIARQANHADWGLMRLDRAVTDHAPLPIRRSGVITDNRKVMVIGHPLGLPRKYAGGQQTTVRDNTNPLIFQANLDVYGGSSGSAVFDADSLQVEGILVAGNVDFREDGLCDRSVVCPDATGCPEWEGSTRTTLFSGLLPTFDLYLGTSAETLELIASNLPVPWYQPELLEAERRYYWKVEARNQCAVDEGPVWSFTTAAAGTPFLRRGDCNDDGKVNVADATCALDWLFGGGQQPDCLAALNTNGDADVNLVDAVYLLLFLFSGGPARAAPFPDCAPGMLPADERLGCAKPPNCQ